MVVIDVLRTASTTISPVMRARIDLGGVSTMSRIRTIEIRGVWLIKGTANTGNEIEVLVELADGTHRVAITEVADDGSISHYVHPAGILAAPVREFDDGSGV